MRLVTHSRSRCKLVFALPRVSYHTSDCALSYVHFHIVYHRMCITVTHPRSFSITHCQLPPMCTLCYPLHCPPLSCALCMHPKLLFCSDLHKHLLMHYFINNKCCAVLCVYCPTEQCLLFFSLLCFLPFAVALFCILSAILCVTLRYAMPGVQRFPIRRQNTPLSRQDTPKTQPEVKLDCWWLIFAFCPTHISLLIRQTRKISLEITLL